MVEKKIEVEPDNGEVSLAVANEETKRKKQSSRKGKKNWRKNIDIGDVEEGLAELVTEEIEGGKIHERKDDDLFTVDVMGDEKSNRKANKETKKLRVDQILEKRSHVAAPLSRVVVKESVASEVETNRINDIAKRIKAGDIKRETRRGRKKKREEAKGKKIAEFDLWDNAGTLKEVKQEPKLIDINAIPTPVAAQMPASMGRNRVQMEAVKVSHPGASYRPTDDEHKELLAERHGAIKRHTRAEKAINAKLAYPSHWDDEKEDEEDSTDEEEQNEDNENAEAIKRKEAKRKTKAQRNREKRQREMEMQAAESRKKKKINKQLGRLNEIKQEVEVEEKEHEKRVEERKKQRELEAVQPKKKLGKRSVPQALVQVQKVEDLTDSLRRLKTEGNLLRDRYHSLLERNVIEPRVRVGQRRKYKRKVYEKPSFRNFV
ncbi:ribosome biogenesis protein Nop53/GLTSCR2 [Syncephalis plumigaleata]|nr:ribosome biogenesis protein Nop53/GLTSCR2 [Syncephalis plumigaleata]